jgi:hypothetical protein
MLQIVTFACYSHDDDVIYMAPDLEIIERQHTFLHEIGHRFDAHRMTDARRNEFRGVAHALPGPWLADTSTHTPGEQFAEAFATCAMSRNFDKLHAYTLSDWEPSQRRFRSVCAWLRSVTGS